MGLTTWAVVVMGPSACGKSEVASALAEHFSCHYLDGDSLHPAKNIHKMETGVPLSDSDRLPWLESIKTEMNKRLTTLQIKKPEDEYHNHHKFAIVVACSALKKTYRDILRQAEMHNPDVRGTTGRVLFVFIDCSRRVLQERIERREGHFMKVEMLDSQLATLERPVDENDVISVNGDSQLVTLLEEITSAIRKIIS